MQSGNRGEQMGEGGGGGAWSGQQGLVVRFDVTRTQSVNCNGQPHRVCIAVLDFQPRLEYECVPRRAPTAYLRALVCNTSPMPLLAGPAAVYLNNAFISRVLYSFQSRSVRVHSLLFASVEF